MFVLSDMAYSEIYFDRAIRRHRRCKSPGAMDVCVEVNTLSKTYSMAGFRVGFALGNERLIAALARVKSYLDYGAYTPIQVAAAAALNGPQDCVEEMRQTYKSAPRRAGRQLRQGGLADSRIRPRRCSAGRRCRRSSRIWARSNSPSV